MLTGMYLLRRCGVQSKALVFCAHTRLLDPCSRSLYPCHAFSLQGAVPFINSTTLLSATASILAVEAYHAGAVRATLLTMAKEYLYPYGVTVAEATSAIAALRASVDGLVSVSQ